MTLRTGKSRIRTSPACRLPTGRAGYTGATMQSREQRVVAELRVEFPRLGRRVSAVTTDVSKRGIFVTTRDYLPAGEVVELNIFLDELVPVRIVSRVVHILSVDAARALGREPGMGLEFLENDSVRLEALRKQLGKHFEQVRPPRAREQKLIVADASPRLVERLVAVLQDAGFQVTPAGSGSEVYEAAQSVNPHGILVSDVLPVMDGWRLLKRLKSHPALSAIPVAMTSSAEGDLSRVSAYRMGAADFIRKPFADEELVLRMDTLVAHHRPTAEQSILRGRLAEISTGTLLSLFEFERKSGLLILTGHGQLATLFLAEGRVVKVDPIPDGMSSKDYLMQVLDWHEGRFEFLLSEVVGGDDIEMATSQLLLEHARLRDEASRR